MGRRRRTTRHRLLGIASTVTALLVAAAQLDIGLRAPTGVRGRPRRWRLIALLGWVGPLSYFRFGRIRWDRFGALRASAPVPRWLDRLVDAGDPPADDAAQPMVAADLVHTRLGDVAVHRLGAGRPVVLWHALLVDGSSWGWVIPALLPGRRLLVVDGPGWGRSDRLTRRVPGADVVGTAIDVLTALAPGEAVDWVGDGWGGRIGIELAATHPDLVHSVVATSAATGALGGGQRLRTAARASALHLLGPLVPQVRQRMLSILLTDAARSEPDVVGSVLDAIALAGQRSAAAAIRSFEVPRRDLTPLLSRVAAPTLLVVGGDDPAWTVSDARAAAAHMPNARVVVVPNSRTLAPLEAPQLLGTLITDFWATIDAR